ncbi:16S rRNA (cytosine(1402)-N(4))-methyltransferase RsmH [Bifidobacterium sp.]|jgi:16S rRNA (cytosine1402-N4)-methyltransferase|uniref:16S rRNA (cytosine(1402)-N(4))-methyltransferase RsmH n=1 Tax=Bifidobacterium sp. TaxID=41200 RepID=UPI0025C27376|nr:16S rRNA (cytosine(1402)-N(4))-methyltransferase RsmH [Bifidobacterium sp.]MCH4209270.1 16S rRNA (cytosine(1402)-N(4))-methyltransferase RsmH [Bifidobacterium sp.]MCI1224064.1 16S rRNA (cytosine(1402)-N(4))-methyltransferase RsmH [Bifidobacterium sp.]
MTDFSAIHNPVLLEQCVQLVAPALNEPGSIVVDCTLGLAGHACAFLAAAPAARLIGIDRDAEALAMATQRMYEAGFAARFTPVHAAFDELSSVLAQRDIAMVNAVFMDLGLSSLQIDENERGFSYSHDAPLDMRMDTSQSLTAQHVLASYDERDLERIFRAYGEERFSRQIAREIVRRREREPLSKSSQLNALVDAVVPLSHRPAGNPAKRVFQALRIEVNGELDKLASTLPQAALHLAPGGRIVVESYHSLEDKEVKSFMNLGLHADVPAGLPVIPPDAQPFFRPLTRGAIKADDKQIEGNPRSASVRLRGVELTRPLPDRFASRFELMSRGRLDEDGPGSRSRFAQSRFAQSRSMRSNSARTGTRKG